MFNDFLQYFLIYIIHNLEICKSLVWIWRCQLRQNTWSPLVICSTARDQTLVCLYFLGMEEAGFLVCKSLRDDAVSWILWTNFGIKGIARAELLRANNRISQHRRSHVWWIPQLIHRLKRFYISSLFQSW